MRGTRKRLPGAHERVSTVVGVLLLSAAIGCFGWVGYQWWGTNVVAERAFAVQRDDLRRQWRQEQVVDRGVDQGRASADRHSPAERGVSGSTIALLRIPKFGPHYEVPIVEGSGLDVLARGVGHYETTAGPGEIGNFAVAGHRITHGEPFSRLLTLDPGDSVVVETKDVVFTYVLDTAPRDLTVENTASWVLDPVPNHPERRPARALITLTTCQDLFHSPDRSVGFGHLQSSEPK